MHAGYVLEAAALETNVRRRGEVGLEEEDEIHSAKDEAREIKMKAARTF